MEQFAMSAYSLGGLMCFVGGVWLIINAFCEHILWGFGCLLFPPVVGLFFVIFHWKEANRPFFLWLIGFVLVFLAKLMMPS